MNTDPPGNFELHVGRLRNFLAEYLPEVADRELQFCETKSLTLREGTNLLRKEDVMTTSQAAQPFSELCAEGREWIHLSGVGFMDQTYLVKIDSSAQTGFPKVAVNIAGPRLDPNGTPVRHAKVRII